MSGILKTKEVSEQLDVNPTTVQRWAKYFCLKCETNEYGHYLFSMEHVELLKQVQQQLQDGKRMKDVDISAFPHMITDTKKQEKMIATPIYEDKIEHVLDRVNDLEHRLSQKADEVVSYQLLKHRSELEEMKNIIKGLERRLKKMESKVKYKLEDQREDLPLVAGETSKRKWRTIMQLFTF